MNIINVELGERSYPIMIGDAMLGQFPDALQNITACNNCIVVADQTVAEFHIEPLVAILKSSGVQAHLITFPAGEQSKAMHTFETVISEIVKNGGGRDWPLLAFGGGVVGDLAGFVAASYMRGLPFIQMPTTLLAQVDSSVGGKVGINHPFAKNLIGAFYQPRLVWIDTDYLKTLPQREIICGFAEIAKYGMISDPQFFEFCEGNLHKILHLDRAAISIAIARSCEIKAKIVAQDEQDWGLREILNFGHTVGHALEACLDYSHINHGEAVFWGMFIEGMIAQEMGIFSKADFSRFRRFLAQIPLKASIEGIKPEKIINNMQLDKKARKGKLRFVLPVSIGRTMVIDDVDQELISHSLRYAQRHEWTALQS